MRRGLVKSVAGLLLAAGVLMLFGCGGSSGNSGDSSLTQAQFTKKVNQQCKKEKVERKQAEDATLRKLGIGPGELATPAQQAKIVAASVPPYERITKQIQEFAPSDQEKTIDSLVQWREKVADRVRSGGSSEVALATIIKANELANEQGLKECSI
jgi:ubiquitin